MRILVVEDELKVGAYLRKGLSELGFLVVHAETGIDGYHLAVTEEFDLIVLDVMLPDMDGWQILKALRDAGKNTPVIFLTAKDSVDDKVKGLELGADDYLVKPFAFAELQARIRTLLKRGQTQRTSDSFVVDDLILDIPKRSVTRGGESINLTAKEFSLLELFVRRQGEVLTRSFLASQVWDMNFESDNNVIDVAIKRLRKKIDGQSTIKLIHTVRGMGYRLDVLTHED
jgi:two-component system copper resistance phosphate regulon response regulator CusR